MAQKRDFDHDRLTAVALARIINKVHGGMVISAMEVEQLDDTWVDVFVGITYDLPQKERRAKLIQRKFEEFERSHPTYSQRFVN